MKAFLRNYQLYMLVIPSLAIIAVFSYWPMYGAQVAFKSYSPVLGMWSSPWVGMEHFSRFFHSYQFWRILGNTVILSVYTLVLTFPSPILLALLLNSLRNRTFKRFVQTVTYAPHFISTVVIVGMVMLFLSPSSGMLNTFIRLFGGEAINFMANPDWFRTIYVLSGVWQTTGWSAIIYLAALSSVNPELYEAATMDGAGKFKLIVHIDIPAIVPITVIMLLLSLGSIMDVGFEKVYLFQNALNADVTEIIQTYVYKVGLQGAQVSYSTAIGLFNSVINFAMIVTFNALAKRWSGISLW